MSYQRLFGIFFAPWNVKGVSVLFLHSCYIQSGLHYFAHLVAFDLVRRALWWRIIWLLWNVCFVAHLRSQWARARLWIRFQMHSWLHLFPLHPKRKRSESSSIWHFYHPYFLLTIVHSYFWLDRMRPEYTQMFSHEIESAGLVLFDNLTNHHLSIFSSWNM